MITFSFSKTALVSTGALVTFLLAACGSDNSTTTSAPQTAVVTTTATPSSSSANPTESAPATSGAVDGVADTADLLAALDRVLEVRPEGLVVQADHEDGTAGSFDIDLVLDQAVHEFKVLDDGSALEEGFESDADEVNLVHQVSVPAATAVATAAEGRGGQVARGLDLETRNSIVVWEIDFEDASGKALGTVVVDAVSGEIIP